MTNTFLRGSAFVRPHRQRSGRVRRIRACLIFLALGLGTVSGQAIAQNVQTTIETPEGEMVSPGMVPTAPVLLDGEILFHVRGISAYPAEQRAKKISERIEAFAADVIRSPQSLRLVEEKNMTLILADKQVLLGVTEADSRLEGGVERELLAQAFLNRITEAVKLYREQRQTPNLLMNTFYALGATTILVFGWWGLRKMFHKLDVTIERRYQSRVKDLTIQKIHILQAEQVWAGLRGVLNTFHLFLLLFLLYSFLNFVFRLFPWTSSLGKQLFTMMIAPVRALGHGALETIPNLIFIGILVVLFRYILKLGKLFFANLAKGKVTFKGFDQEWAWPTYRIFRTLIIAFGVVIAYPKIPGSGSEVFQGISIFLGILLSLGSTSVIGNIIAGYTLVYRRAFREGDRIRINEHIGDVMERRLLVTHLRSMKNEEIVVPNSEILNSHVINYSTLARQEGLILHITTGIGYETPWRQVEAILMEAAARTPGLLNDPAPFVLQLSLGDFCITYELNVYCDKPHEMMELYTLLSQSILDVFNEHGVQIMTPAYRGDPEQPKIVPKDQWFAPPARPLENNQRT